MVVIDIIGTGKDKKGRLVNAGRPVNAQKHQNVM